MGRSTTPTYRFEARAVGVAPITECWRGKATEKRLQEHVEGTNESMKAGGVNAHVSKALGFIPIITSAKLIHQATGSVVAEYQTPMFKVS